jgi:alkyl sulfatase BDS1-like metallo-beta-lactamase superfamily hydrolase
MRGTVGSEIAEAMRLPPALEGAWHARGYYGSVSHNVRATYQRYMGWYDGNPAHLDLRNGVLVHRATSIEGVDATMRTTRAALPGLLAGATGSVRVEGDRAVLGQLMAVHESPDPDFAIVSP